MKYVDDASHQYRSKITPAGFCLVPNKSVAQATCLPVKCHAIDCSRAQHETGLRHRIVPPGLNRRVSHGRLFLPHGPRSASSFTLHSGLCLCKIKRADTSLAVGVHMLLISTISHDLT